MMRGTAINLKRVKDFIFIVSSYFHNYFHLYFSDNLSKRVDYSVISSSSKSLSGFYKSIYVDFIMYSSYSDCLAMFIHPKTGDAMLMITISKNTKQVAKVVAENSRLRAGSTNFTLPSTS